MASDGRDRGDAPSDRPCRVARACRSAPTRASERWCSTADGSTVAEGFHRGAGTPHAEVDALHAAGDRARAATVVVTLEPCNHQGRTGPCAEALIAAGVGTGRGRSARPHAEGAGRRRASARRRRRRRGGRARRRCRAAINPRWTFAQDHQRPFVTWKFAATLDGRSAAADGTSQWITGPDARADVHRLRAECDAIMVGTGTVLADDPQLTVAVTERRASAAPSASRCGSSSASVTCRPTRASSTMPPTPRRRLATTRRCVLEQVYESGRQHVWLEGGPTLAAAFLRAGLVDEVIAYVAPALLGAGRQRRRRTSGSRRSPTSARFTITDVDAGWRRRTDSP